MIDDSSKGLFDLVIVSTLEECYASLLVQAQWVNLTFASGKGKHKTQLQRDIETIKAFLDKKNEYYSHLGKFGNRNSFSKTDIDATFILNQFFTLEYCFRTRDFRLPLFVIPFFASFEAFSFCFFLHIHFRIEKG